MVIDSTQLSVGSNSLQEGSNEVFFTVSVASDYQSADAVEDNMWNIAAYLTSSSDGSGKRQLLSRQVLSPLESSQHLPSGSRTRFYNLRTDIRDLELDCNSPNYLCVELSRSPNAPSSFSFTSTRSDSLSSCERLNCARKRKSGVKRVDTRN